MSIWTYENNRLENKNRNNIGQIEQLWTNCTRVKDCIYCNQPLLKVNEQQPSPFHVAHFNEIVNYGKLNQEWHGHNSFRGHQHENFKAFEDYSKICTICGWWIAFRNEINDNSKLRTYGGMAGLIEFDVSSPEAPLNDLRDFLVANYASRNDIHPRVFEQVVADVYKDLGYKTRVTAYSGDGGLDVILDGDNSSLIGIQVKRYKNLIKVEKIRELTGALVINGMTSGIFVTTSDFQSGAEQTAEKSGARGYPIQLINANRFYDALKLSHLKKFGNQERSTEHIHMSLIEERSL